MSPEELTPDEAKGDTRYDATVYQGSDDLFKKYWQEARAMYLDNLASLITGPLEDFSIRWLINEAKFGLSAYMSSPRATFVALTEKGSSNLVGFTIGIPDEVSDLNTDFRKQEKEQLEKVEGEGAYQRRTERTAHVPFTIIKPEHREKKGWTPMMTALDTALKTSGQYDEITRTARDGGNYSQKVEGRYSDRIITKIPNIPSPYGPVTYFRIRL